MNTKLTFGAFEIEIREDNTTNQFLQELLNYTYKNILREATNDSQLINIFFEYFHKDPNTRFSKHYQEIDYEEVYAREQFYSDEEEIQGIFIPPSHIDDQEIITIDSDDSESTTQVDSEEEESEVELFITLNQLRHYQEPRYWTDSEPDSEYNYIENYDSDNSLPYSADLDSE
jgi:hypothetical protein